MRAVHMELGRQLSGIANSRRPDADTAVAIAMAVHRAIRAGEDVAHWSPERLPVSVEEMVLADLREYGDEQEVAYYLLLRERVRKSQK